jgi:hypothetical protein
MLDYTTVDFPFTEFPKGLTSLYLIKAKKTFIKSNYAISTKEPTLLICKESKIFWRWENLRDRAIVFWSKKTNGFTERKFKLSDQKGTSNGQGIDFSKDFKVINSQKITGEIQSAD